MTALLIVGVICLFFGIFSSAQKRQQASSWKSQNQASFVAEVEEYARWGEMLFKEYCDLVGNHYTRLETANAMMYKSNDFYFCDDGSLMPKIDAHTRSSMGTKFYDTFRRYKNKEAIEALRVKYNLPTDHAMRFEKGGGEFNVYTDLHKEYYKSLYDIMYLCIYRALRFRGLNLKGHYILETEIEEYRKIREVIKAYPWFIGEFRRY